MFPLFSSFSISLPPFFLSATSRLTETMQNEPRFGQEAMEEVLQKRRLHRKAIELMLRHEPEQMVDLVAIFEEWKGRENELVAMLTKKYRNAVQKQTTEKDVAGILQVKGSSTDEHVLIAMDVLQGMDITLRAAATRTLFTKASPHSNTTEYLEAVHLLNYLRDASTHLQIHFGRAPGSAPTIARELAFLSTMR